MSTFTYRTFNPSPTDYERALADALFTIMGQRVYDPSAIAAQLNKTDLKPAHGDLWTGDILKSEMERLGSWSNCVGGPPGSHTLPGASQRRAI